MCGMETVNMDLKRQVKHRRALSILAAFCAACAFAAPRRAFQTYAVRDLCEKDFAGHDGLVRFAPENPIAVDAKFVWLEVAPVKGISWGDRSARIFEIRAYEKYHAQSMGRSRRRSEWI